MSNTKKLNVPPESIQLPSSVGTAIAPLQANAARPLISVMLPVYEPNEYLLDALRSVLAQDLGPKDMQITVVDDASSCDVESLVAQIGEPGRIEIYRASVNQGLAGNWNQCIRLARGQIVHLLHQDDWVAEGFYSRLLPAFANRPRVGMAFCRHAIAESKERIVRYSHRERLRAGVLKNWLARIAERQRIQCVSVVVKRSVYEQLGGYCPDLCYALDWEMWVRIAANFDVWYEPRKLAYYLRHKDNETHRLARAGRISEDLVTAIERFGDHLPPERKERLQNAAFVYFVRRTLKDLKKAAAEDVQCDVSKQLQLVRGVLDRITGSPKLAKELLMSIKKFDVFNS